MSAVGIRVGIDLGGTKIAAIAFGETDEVLFESQAATPREDYEATIAAIAALVTEAETATGARAWVGVGMPGSISPASGLVQNANSTWLNTRPFDHDLAEALERPLRFANDANCFALSEARDGAAREADTVFGVILGTGCGGAIVTGKQLLTGRHAIAGEWGHTPLPAPTPDEQPGPECWCGRRGCLETWLSGPGLAEDHVRSGGAALTAEQIAGVAARGDELATATLSRHLDRLARGLGNVVDIVDPDVIVIGGGLSNLAHLYDQLPGAVAPHVFADSPRVDIRPPAHGPASGVRGAARLWTAHEAAHERTAT